MPETSRECVVCLLDDTSFTVPVKVSIQVSSFQGIGTEVCSF